MKVVLPILLSLLFALACGGLAHRLWRRGAFDGIAAWWRGASRPARIAFALFFGVAAAYGSDKDFGGATNRLMQCAGRFVGGVVANLFSPVEQATGYAALSRTDEPRAIPMPDDAVVAENIAKRGAHDDGFWLFDSFTNRLVRDGLVRGNPVWVQTDGTVTVNSPSFGVPIAELAEILAVSNVTVYAPMQGSFGFLPESRWGQFAVSRIWTAVTERGSRLVTWEGAMPLRLTDNPVTFQAEFLQGGDVVYRYNGIPTNEVADGVFRDGTAQTIDVATNTTSVALKYVGDLGDGAGDTDGDGLADWEEVRLYGTDPRLADTDGDGLSDADELADGTDPLDPDTDGDGVPDGFTAETYSTHPLRGSETNWNFAVRLAAPCPDDARAVMAIGGLAAFLDATNTAYFRLEGGLRYDMSVAATGDKPVSIEVFFDGDIPAGRLMAVRPGVLGAPLADGEDYGWFVDDPGGMTRGNRKMRDSVAVAKVTVSLSVREGYSECVHAGESCVYDVVMSPPDWEGAKRHAILDGLTLLDDGGLELSLDGGENAFGTLDLGFPYFKTGGVTLAGYAHRCSGFHGFLCPFCGTVHGEDDGCRHDVGCPAGHGEAADCTCPPTRIPLNCDDDDADGTEDRFQAAAASGEDDLESFALFHAAETWCCCDEIGYGGRIEAFSPSLRLWGDGAQHSVGDTCGPVVSVEGVATNDNAFARYAVLDGDGEAIRTVTRHFRIAVEAGITLDAMTCGGGALVIKRPTDPARFNSATGTVHVLGAGADGLVLEGAKVLFEPSGNGSMLVDGDSSFTFYGDTPSASMNDASITLKTPGGETLATTNLTVLWVDISMRCGQGDSLSPDNGAPVQYPPGILGTCQMITNVTISGSLDGPADSLSNVAEFVGKVHPSDFADAITLNRSFSGQFAGISYASPTIITNLYRPGIPWPGDLCPQDTGPVECRDDNPMPNGYVYDVDTPGIHIGSQALGSNIPSGTILYFRDNFIEYAMFGSVRCSDNFPWFNCGTFQSTGASGVLLFDFYNRGNHNYDNAIGPGYVPLTTE